MSEIEDSIVQAAIVQSVIFLGEKLKLLLEKSDITEYLKDTLPTYISNATNETCPIPSIKKSLLLQDNSNIIETISSQGSMSSMGNRSIAEIVSKPSFYNLLTLQFPNTTPVRTESAYCSENVTYNDLQRQFKSICEYIPFKFIFITILVFIVFLSIIVCVQYVRRKRNEEDEIRNIKNAIENGGIDVNTLNTDEGVQKALRVVFEKPSTIKSILDLFQPEIHKIVNMFDDRSNELKEFQNFTQAAIRQFEVTRDDIYSKIEENKADLLEVRDYIEESLQRNVQDFQDRIESLVTKYNLRENLKLLELLRGQVIDLEGGTNKVKEQIRTLTTSFETNHTQLENLQHQNQDLIQKFKEQKDNLKKSQNQLEELQQQNQDLIKKFKEQEDNERQKRIRVANTAWEKQSAQNSKDYYVYNYINHIHESPSAVTVCGEENDKLSLVQVKESNEREKIGKFMDESKFNFQKFMELLAKNNSFTTCSTTEKKINIYNIGLETPFDKWKEFKESKDPLYRKDIIIAFGISGSGKTYTLFDYKNTNSFLYKLMHEGYDLLGCTKLYGELQDFPEKNILYNLVLSLVWKKPNTQSEDAESDFTGALQTLNFDKKYTNNQCINSVNAETVEQFVEKQKLSDTKFYFLELETPLNKTSSRAATCMILRRRREHKDYEYVALWDIQGFEQADNLINYYVSKDDDKVRSSDDCDAFRNALSVAARENRDLTGNHLNDYKTTYKNFKSLRILVQQSSYIEKMLTLLSRTAGYSQNKEYGETYLALDDTHTESSYIKYDNLNVLNEAIHMDRIPSIDSLSLQSLNQLLPFFPVCDIIYKAKNQAVRRFVTTLYRSYPPLSSESDKLQSDTQDTIDLQFSEYKNLLSVLYGYD